MPVLETIGFQATAPGATGTTAAIFPGDTATIRGAPGTAGARILAVTIPCQTTGYAQVVRASGHDQIRGARYGSAGGRAISYIIPGAARYSPPGETLSVTIAGSATTGDIERCLVHLYYDSLTNLNQDLVDFNYVRAHGASEVTIYASISPGTTGGWSGEEPLTQDSDLLRADRRYAVLGAATTFAAFVPYIRGPGTAGLRIAIPADITVPQFAPHWFAFLSHHTGLPTIPVIHGASRNAWFIGMTADENAAAHAVTLHMVELPPA